MEDKKDMKITITKDGPYVVEGKVPLVKKTQIVSEYGEPLTWQTLEKIETDPQGYALCRCGKSSHQPFCDGTHLQIRFNGTETALTDGSEERMLTLPDGKNLIVHVDSSLCMSSGFCNLRNIGLVQLVIGSEDTLKRSLAMAMIERCPSGALTYQVEPDGPEIEPDLPMEIADSIEITSDGPIEGPLWVTGYLPIERSDGMPFVARNRVTLCRCGQSRNKPLCDGTHRHHAAWESFWKK